MAAKAPANGVHGWSREELSHEGLEVGFSGLSLAGGTSSSGHTRISTDSTLSTSPVILEQARKTSSAPVSPSMERLSLQLPKGPLPSPIGKAGNTAASRNTTATSPQLTLTPNSSEADWNSLGKSPFGSVSGNCEMMVAPPIPFLQQNEASTSNYIANVGEHRRGHEQLGFHSFDLAVENNDGLLGLEALRDRAHSYHNDQSPSRLRSVAADPLLHQQHQQQRRSADRPPLSQSYGSSSGLCSGSGGDFASVHYPACDRGNSGSHLPYSSSSSLRSHDVNNSSMDSTLSGYGAIGQLRQNGMEFDPTNLRQRACSQGENPFHSQHDIVTQKFGALPSLQSHLHHFQQQQGQSKSFTDVPRGRHMRSISQPGPPPESTHGYYDPDSSHYSYKSTRSMPHSASMSHPPVYVDSQESHNTSFESMPNLHPGSGSNSGAYRSYNASHIRRDVLDLHLSPGSEISHYAMSSANSDGYSSGGLSPLQNYYTNNTSAASGKLMSDRSDSRILSSQNMHRGNDTVLQQHFSDDDLAHPLVGEHIEVPDQHEDPSFIHQLQQFGGATYFASNSQSLPRGHSHSLSLDAMPQQLPKEVYIVKFKRSQRNFTLGPRIMRDLKIGTYVKVEADRGEDLGIVVGKIPIEEYSGLGSSRSSFSAGMGPPGGGSGNVSDLKRITRLATHEEVSLLAVKREEEAELLRICLNKVRQRGLRMTVVDAEYQFDRHKLTFFFEAEGRVDFRELVRDLFSMYKTRIWMQQLDKHTCTSAQAIMAPQAANLQIDYGTPIIAPVSEFADSIRYTLGGNQ